MRRQQLELLLSWEPEKIILSLEHPTPYMGAWNLKLHRLALRRLGVCYR
jgi:hypothetical protein